MSGKRRLFARACAVVTAVVLLASLAGCSTGGNIYTLDELAERGEITLDDIKNIAALRYGPVRSVEYGEDGKMILTNIEYTVRSIDAEVDDSVKKAIARDYVAQRGGEGISLCEVTDYYGTYGGYVVAEIKLEYENAEAVTDAVDIVVSGIYLGTAGRNNTVVAWRQSGEINRQ